MNFDEIENLTERQVNELYEDIIENTNDSILGSQQCTICPGGYYGCHYFAGQYGAKGDCWAGIQYSYNGYNCCGVSQICGNGVYGYSCVR